MKIYQYPPNPSITIASPPVQYVLNGLPVSVAEDSAVPANNRTFPIHNFVIKNGVQLPINIDTVTPANNNPMPSGLYVQDWATGSSLPVILDSSGGSNNRAIPVKVVDLAGGNINITAGDINVQLSDAAPNYDRTRIGDGSSRQGTWKDGVDNSTDYALIVQDENIKNAIGILATPAPAQAILAGLESSTGDIDNLVADANRNLRVGNKDSINFTLNSVVTAANRDTVIPANSRPIPVIQLDNSGNPVSSPALDYGVSTAALRVASQIGNASGIANFNAGSTGLQTLRVVSNIQRDGNELAYDSGASSANTLRIVLATRHEAAATPVSIRKGNGTNFDSYDDGISDATTPRVSSNLKFEGVDPDLNTGAATAATLRTVLATRHETVTTPLAARLSDGTNFNSQTAPAWARLSDGTDPITAAAIATAQLTQATVTKAIQSISTLLGWDGTTHREIAVDTNGQLKTVDSPTSGTITNTLKTVGTSAVRATVAGTAPNAARKKLLIKPSKNNTGAIYLGSSSVTTANGLEIIGPDRIEFIMDASDYYLISDTAAQSVEIVEVI